MFADIGSSLEATVALTMTPPFLAGPPASVAWDSRSLPGVREQDCYGGNPHGYVRVGCLGRSEEHTSELQSRLHLVCRLLLEKKKTNESTPRGASPTRSPIRRSTP